MSKILEEIIKEKKQEVLKKKKSKSFFDLESESVKRKTNSFSDKLIKNKNQKRISIIAEIKKASPSKGLLRNDFDPVKFALEYEKNKAACLSVLTDEKFFQGCLDYLVNVKSVVEIPVLRKDFIIDSYQVLESFNAGADCILLIASALPLSLMKDLESQAMSLGMECLIEIHDEVDLKKYLECRSMLVGINNRNLQTFEVNLDVSLGLCGKLPKNRVIISESGVNSFSDLIALTKGGIDNFLIGELFMRDSNPGLSLKKLLLDFENK